MAAKPFKRAGLHRLECPDCPCYGYFTVAMLERAGQLPVCFAPECGATMIPAELELAFMLGLTDAPAVVEYQRRVQGAEMAQARGVGSWSRAASRVAEGSLNPMSVKVAADMRAERRQRARENRLQALRPAAEPMPF